MSAQLAKGLICGGHEGVTRWSRGGHEVVTRCGVRDDVACGAWCMIAGSSPTRDDPDLIMARDFHTLISQNVFMN